MKEFGIVIGRFDPFHLGHEKLIQKAILEKGLDSVLVLVGSVNSHLIDNKAIYKYTHRYKMVKSIFPDVKVIGIADMNNALMWTNYLVHIIACVFEDVKDISQISAYSGSKEDSEYLSKAGFKVHLVDRRELGLSGTLVRKTIKEGGDISSMVNPNIKELILETHPDKSGW